MGRLDIKPFRKAMKRKFPVEGEEKAVELWSLWENYCGDSSCHPIKIIADNKGLCKVKLLSVIQFLLSYPINS